ncbi:ATP-dependent Clp protease proteolytic subunit [Paenibacillus larvae]|nr:ATP-dependent Clp protease proteolytic subunit [Paenibacillus larvae]MDT2239098.1 ATP-dependent Clp protease proteolytic subunit [Paenibacillus larvae]
MMVHNPWTFTMGEASDLRQTADILDTIRDALVEVYMSKTGLQEERAQFPA